MRTELTLAMEGLTIRMAELTKHVEDVREESKQARQHLETNLERMNGNLSEVDKHSKSVEFRLANEVMDREKAVFQLGAELKEMLATETGEREKEDSSLASALAGAQLNLENKIQTDDLNTYAKTKQDLHESEVAAATSRRELREELLLLTKNMDEKERGSMLQIVGEATTAAKAYERERAKLTQSSATLTQSRSLRAGTPTPWATRSSRTRRRTWRRCGSSSPRARTP